ncbi:uncharacterized protein GJ701_000411 isoform 1-T1 [Geothlypis trichas]
MSHRRGAVGTFKRPAPPRAWRSWHKQKINASRSGNGAARETLGRWATVARKGGGRPRRWFRPRTTPTPPLPSPGARDRWSRPRRRARALAAVTWRRPPRSLRARRTASLAITREPRGVRAGRARPGLGRSGGKSARDGNGDSGEFGLLGAPRLRILTCFLVLMVQRPLQEWTPGQGKVLNNANEDSE